MASLDGLASFWLFLCFVVGFLFSFSNGKFLRDFLNVLCRQQLQKWKFILTLFLEVRNRSQSRSCPFNEWQRWSCRDFFLLLPLLGIHRFSPSCSVCWVIWHLGVQPITSKGAERRSSAVPSQTSDSSVLSDCHWWKGSIKLSQGRKTMTSI